MRLNPCPARYRPAVAFSAILYPQSHQCSSRSTCPEGQKYGLTTFHIIDKNGLGSTCPPVLLRSACVEKGATQLKHIKPVSIFGLSLFTTFLSGSHVLAIPSSLAPWPRDARSGPYWPHGFRFVPYGTGALSCQFQTGPLPVPHVAVGYWRQNARFAQDTSFSFSTNNQ